MRITLVTVGRTDIPWVRTGLEMYVSRLEHYVPFSLREIPELKGVSALSKDQIKEREGELILKQVRSADEVVLLDEHGKEHTSVGFSQYLQKQMNAGIRTLVFVVGGAFGFAPSVYAAASDKISLSQMTFNHQMVRLFFVEQLYRAFTILRHEPYHNE